MKASAIGKVLSSGVVDREDANDTKMLQDAQQAMKQLKTSARQRVTQLSEYAQNAAQIDQMVEDWNKPASTLSETMFAAVSVPCFMRPS